MGVWGNETFAIYLIKKKVSIRPSVLKIIYFRSKSYKRFKHAANISYSFYNKKARN